MNNILTFLVLLFFFVNIAIAFMPYWTRKTENFGVTIPTSLYYRQDFKSMRKKYTFSLTIINIILFAILLGIGFNLNEKTTIIAFIILTFVYIIASFLVYLPFHHEMKKVKQNENWKKDRKQTIVIDTKFREGKLTYSNGWYIIPALIIIATISYTFIVYDNIPDQVPIHTSFSGTVTYDDKSMGNLLLLPITQIFMLCIFIGVNYVIKQSKQQNVLFRKRWSLFMIVSAFLITIMFTFMQFTFIYPALLVYQDIVLYSVIGIVLFGTILLSVFTGQGGSRIKVTDEQMDEQFIERDDDHLWKLGQFYVNRNDPSIFVEKRFGIGWTNNWAHPISWIVIIIIIGLGIGIPVLITLL